MLFCKYCIFCHFYILVYFVYVVYSVIHICWLLLRIVDHLHQYEHLLKHLFANTSVVVAARVARATTTAALGPRPPCAQRQSLRRLYRGVRQVVRTPSVRTPEVVRQYGRQTAIQNIEKYKI